ncbi:MAG: FeoB-associated Cys-rich membrane protein [Clostridia bacterium]|nr:FeoB-associated Cys-rich membrane protein [Clostridia bacterium]
MLANIIVSAVLIAMAGLIIFYLIRAKKRGETCIGCPHAKECKGKCGGNCSKDE